MNKFLPSAFAAALTLVATVGFAQPRSAYAGYTPMNFGQGSVGSSTSSNTSAAAISRNAGSQVGHVQVGATANSNARTSDRRYTQAQYVITAVVVPLNQDLRGAAERVLRTGAATKGAAMSRMRQLISDIGVQVRVVSLDIVRQ